ncbi:MAG: diguanylate cyclase, partial [Mesorhizobium sp.]
PAHHRCTASFGVAELHPTENFSDLLQRADEALYQAKGSGRDCVRISIGSIATLQTAVANAGPKISGRG